MIDHLFHFATEALADAAFPPPDGAGRPPTWQADGRSVLPCRVWRATEAVAVEGPGGTTTRTNPVFLAGAWRVVSAGGRDPVLEAMPGFRWGWDREGEELVVVVGDGDLECEPWWAEAG